MRREPQSPDQLDAAIDTLLGQAGRPAAVEDDDLVGTVLLLRSVLPGFHPRFGFEERLAARLAATGLSDSDNEGGLIALRPRTASPDEVWAAGRVRRGLLAGGAIASGVSLALPLAGAAVLAWRRARASGGLP
jgi:hypothetical protein